MNPRISFPIVCVSVLLNYACRARWNSDSNWTFLENLWRSRNT